MGGELLDNLDRTIRRARIEFERLDSNEAEELAAQRLIEMFRRFVGDVESKSGDSWLGRRYVKFLKGYQRDLESLFTGGTNNPYAVLGANPAESLGEIKVRYRGLARRYHPDRPNGDQRKMQEINAAYKSILRLRGEK